MRLNGRSKVGTLSMILLKKRTLANTYCMLYLLMSRVNDLPWPRCACMVIKWRPVSVDGIRSLVPG